MNWNNIVQANNKQANNFAKQSYSKPKNENIVNVEVNRIFIKKVFKKATPTGEKMNILLQVGNDIGVFLDTRFVRTDNYSLLASVGICLDYEYSLVKLGEKTNEQIRIPGAKLVDIINNFVNEIESEN